MFTVSWCDFTGEFKLDPMIRTLAYQLKSYRNGVAHYDSTYYSDQADFLLALFCIRKFWLLLDKDNPVDDIDQLINQNAINHIKSVNQEKDLVNIFISGEASPVVTNKWLSKQILEEVEFLSDEFIEYFHDKTIYQMDIDDICYFCFRIFHLFPDELIDRFSYKEMLVAILFYSL